MQEHPVPRQITTFEFKLIGFMTLKQFLYLVVFVPCAFIVWRVFPIPILNILLAIATAGFGVALAFLPINDRPLEVWIRNLIKRLTSPTQYIYQKHNTPLYFLQDLYFVADPHRIVSHIESKEKLATYLQKTQPKKLAPSQKNQIQSLLHAPTGQLRPVASAQTVVPSIPQQPQLPQQSPTPIVPAAPVPAAPVSQTAQPPQRVPVQKVPVQHPFLTGTIKNSKKIPLPGVLVYIKDPNTNVPIRLLKTNPHGIFATFNPLPPGDYAVEIKDPNQSYFFDTMKVSISTNQPTPLEYYSKNIL